MSGRADIFFYVQHLLGIGHLRRAAAIAKALDAAGLKVLFVTGGLPVADLDAGGAERLQLPALMTRDESFSALVDGEGRPLSEAWKAERRDRLLAAYRKSRPKILLIEMFPFGRRQMRFELLPLLEAARAAAPRPAIVCSVRDILNIQHKPEKTAWILETLERGFDRVLVHGDPELLPFEASFPEAGRIAPSLDYTGYVVTAPPEAPRAEGSEGQGDVLVSAGGGRVAGPLIEAAFAARALGPLAGLRWRLLVGAAMPESDYLAYARRASEGMIVERARPDFQALLSRCRLSISQAGYNTVMEVLRAGPPAVVVPFAAGSETEQSQRAGLLAERGVLALVEEAGLSGESLDRGIRQALSGAQDSARRRLRCRMDGAARTALILSGMLDIMPA